MYGRFACGQTPSRMVAVKGGSHALADQIPTAEVFAHSDLSSVSTPGAWSAAGMLPGAALLDRACPAPAMSEAGTPKVAYGRPKLNEALEHDQLGQKEGDMQRSSSVVLGAGSLMPSPQGSRKATASSLGHCGHRAFGVEHIMKRSRSATAVGPSAVGAVSRGRLPR